MSNPTNDLGTTPASPSPRPRAARFRLFGTASFGAVSLGLVLAASSLAAIAVGQTPPPSRDSSSAAPLTIPEPLDLATPFSKIAKEVRPAVVNINTIILPKQGQSDNQGEGGGQNPMQQFFQQFFGGPGGMQGQNPQAQEERGLGSGFIVDPHGYILTAYHVVRGADKIFVKLDGDPENGEGHPATVVGFDTDTDLAVIKIDVGHPLPTVPMGNSEGAQVGDSVEAIGCPFDPSLAETVTAGIVSAKNRNIPGAIGGQFKHFIQTDAAINPGNSGGPLFNMAGQVIGINDAYSTASEGSIGIGFAIPSDTAIHVYNQLIGPEHKVVRGSIGISYQQYLSTAVAKMYDAQNGVLVRTVTPGMAAAKAGLKPNDVIISVDGKLVKNGEELVNNISDRKPGTTVQLGILRNGQKMTLTCEIDNRADIEKAAQDNGSGPAEPGEAPGKKLGITVENLPPDAPSGLHGVLIDAVTPGSFGDELQPPLVAGMVIEGVNRQPVQNKAAFDAIVSRLKSGDDVVLQVAYPNNGNQTGLVGGVLP